jgi:hypothetical protein
VWGAEIDFEHNGWLASILWQSDSQHSRQCQAAGARFADRQEGEDGVNAQVSRRRRPYDGVAGDG